MALLAQIQALIAQSHIAEDVREGMLAFALYDLATKAKALPSDIGTQFTQRAIAAIAAATASRDLADAITFVASQKSEEEKSRLTADVFILTVIDVEKTAVLKAFGIDARAAEQAGAYINVHGRKCYSAQLSVTGPKHVRHILQVYITVVGEPRNVPCANVSRDIIEAIDVDLLMLVGIGGGNPALKVSQGDVIGAQGVFYVEGGKQRLAGGSGFFGSLVDRLAGRNKQAVQNAGEVSTVDPEPVATTLRYPAKEFYLQFKPRSSELTAHFDDAYSRYTPDDLLPGKNTLNRTFQYQQGHIMCGEKVIIDNRLKTSSETLHRKLACVDMESYGFSASCEHKDKPWVIFRGISDFADPKKDDGKHVSASIAAAVTAHAFIKEQFVEREARAEDRL